MSFYAAMKGEIKYDTPEAFHKAKSYLEEQGYVKDNKWDDDDMPDTCEDNISEAKQTIIIPQMTYRNLLRCTDQLFEGGEGGIVWASSDGCLEGGVIINGVEWPYDLETWAEDNDIMRLCPPPIGDDDNDNDDEWENYSIWAGDVMDSFMENALTNLSKEDEDGIV